MLVHAFVALTAAAHLTNAAALHKDRDGWGAKKFKSLVTFGDSFTDDSRLSYFIANNGSAPPVGYRNPANYNSASGGRPWPQYVAQYGGQNIYNYAVSGAVCSNNVTPRFFAAINGNFPDIESYELPAYLADKDYTDPATNKPFLDIPPSRTAYSIWIGTNDLGNNAFLTNDQEPDTNLTSYTDCVYAQVQRLYDSGARYFVLMNAAPLQLLPIYGQPDAGGLGPNQYWKTKPSDPEQIANISIRQAVQVAAVNDIYEYRTPYEALVAENLPGAKLALFDTYSLITDMYYNPAQYLNGTAEPLNVTGVSNVCTPEAVCERSSSDDSYLWYDELHPSEQADRVFAREFLGVLNGNSKWASYYRG